MDANLLKVILCCIGGGLLPLSTNVTFVNVQILLAAVCVVVSLQVCLFAYLCFPFLLYQMSHLPV